MVWDFAESNPFSQSSGCHSNVMMWIVKCILNFPANPYAFVRQFDAQSDCGLRNIMVSTDPPYYDNIGYADLSDFFYVWMRQSLKRTYPKLFRTMLVPKAEELVATPYRFGGSAEQARDFFEDGMFKACCQLYEYVIIAILLFSTLGTTLTLILLNVFSSQVSYALCRYPVLPTLLIVIALILLSAVIPTILFQCSRKTSLIDRLRSVE